MQIINYLLSILVPTVLAANIVTIQKLPGYVNVHDFKISCTSDGNLAQFYVSKHGGSFNAFGPAIDLNSSPCLVSTNSSILDEQTDYTFKVIVDGVESATTSTIYDTSGPSPVNSYSKERTSDAEYKLKFTTPGDTDFDKVIIYRGTTIDFSADANHELARLNGSPNVELTYIDHFSPDASLNYFYAIRAVDRAGNSSSLTGDGSTNIVTIYPSASPGTSGTVTRLPKEGSGSVLGTENGPSSTPQSTAASTENSIGSRLTSSSKVKWVLAGIGIIVLGIGIYFYFRKK